MYSLFYTEKSFQTSYGQKTRAVNNALSCHQTAIALLCSVVLLLASTKALAENYVPYGDTFEPRTYEYNRTPRKGYRVITKDPNVWVYTSEFAQRFGMPEEWVDDTLEGAQAVAYRIEASNRERCGYFGEKESCRPDLQCVFDVYLTDEDSAKLPWESHKSADWQNWDSSRSFLAVQEESDLWYWHDEVNDITYVRTGPTGLRSVVYVEGPPSKKRNEPFSGQGPIRVREYRRDFYQGLDLIELNGCLMVRADNPVRIYFLDPLPSMRELKYRLPNGKIDHPKIEKAEKARYAKFNSGTPPHKVKLPNTYMNKVKVHDKAVRYNRSLAKETLMRLKKGEIDTQTTVPNQTISEQQNKEASDD